MTGLAVARTRAGALPVPFRGAYGHGGQRLPKSRENNNNTAVRCEEDDRSVSTHDWLRTPVSTGPSSLACRATIV